jgi:hypothetical protein
MHKAVSVSFCPIIIDFPVVQIIRGEVVCVAYLRGVGAKCVVLTFRSSVIASNYGRYVWGGRSPAF